MPDLFSARQTAAPAPLGRRAPQAAETEDHRCAVCGEPAGFGFGVSLRRGRPGRWSCMAHREDVEVMAE